MRITNHYDYRFITWSRKICSTVTGLSMQCALRIWIDVLLFQLILQARPFPTFPIKPRLTNQSWNEAWEAGCNSESKQAPKEGRADSRPLASGRHHACKKIAFYGRIIVSCCLLTEITDILQATFYSNRLAFPKSNIRWEFRLPLISLGLFYSPWQSYFSFYS